MPCTAIQIEHLAMATRWRLVLRGNKGVELIPVGDSCIAMIEDWDILLSRFNPASEVSRINRAKPGMSLKLHADLVELLVMCDHARQATHGLFEVALPLEQAAQNTPWNSAPYLLDPQQGTFTWLVPNHRLDFGGIAKGYVLDQLLLHVKKYQVTAALFDAGGSSLLSWDSNANASPWRVTLSMPGEGPRELIVRANLAEDQGNFGPWLELQNMALAYSATRLSGATSGQTFDPRSGTEIAEPRACVVVTPSAAWAEVLSTTALCMGEAEAAKYIKERGLVASRLGWLAGDEVHWYSSHE